MINRLDLRGRSLSTRVLSSVLPRPEVGVEDASRLVAPVVEDVRVRGAAALRDYAEKFDHVRPEHLRVPTDVITAALESLEPGLRAALEEMGYRVLSIVREDVRDKPARTVRRIGDLLGRAAA